MRGVVTPWRVNDAVAYDLLFTDADRSPSDGRDAVLRISGFDRADVDALRLDRGPGQSRRITTTDESGVSDDELLRKRIVPAVFAGSRVVEHPRFVLVAGAPGAGASRAIGGMTTQTEDGIAVISAETLSRFHPEVDDPDPAAQERVAAAATGWLVECLRHARAECLSVLLAGPFPATEAVVGVAKQFREEGFRVEVSVVAVPATECMLSIASTYGARLQRGERPVLADWESSDDAVAHTRRTLEALGQSGVMDQVTVVDRSGRVVFDGHRFDSGVSTAAAAAFDAALVTPMRTLEAVQWLSELKRVTRFARTYRPAVPAELTPALVELHGRGIREVVPTLAVPAGSAVARGLEARLASELIALREVTPHRSPDQSGPVLAPEVPHPSGPSL